MASEPAPQESAASSSVPFEEVDPHGYLHLDMRVVGGHSRTLGKVASFERDAATGRLTGLTVRHGLLKNKRTAVPVSQIKWVNQDSVVLEMTGDAFGRLPRVTGS